ncbi:MAG: transposase [Mycobacteriales bacterium]
MGRRRVRVRTFSAMTRDLLAMRDWLLAEQVTVVGMEATGAYWKPVFYLLEHEVECWLLNARHMKAVPGRKTDVKDAEWIAQLVEHGLVRPSFVPPGAAGPDPLPHRDRPRTHPGGAAAGEAAGRRRDQAVGRRQ